MTIAGIGIGLVAGWVLLIGVLAFAVLVFEIWMFVDAIKNPRLTDAERIIWCIGMLLLHPFVAIAYYFLARRRPEL